jgi:hypothetical protein
MDSKKRPAVPFRDREVLLVKDLDEATLDAIRNVQPSERSRELGRLLRDPEAN